MSRMSMSEDLARVLVACWELGPDGPRPKAIELPFTQVIDQALLARADDATPPDDFNTDDYVAPLPNFRAQRRRGAIQLFLAPRAGAPFLSRWYKLIHHGDGGRFTQISPEGAITTLTRNEAAQQCRLSLLSEQPTMRSIWPPPMPPVAIVENCDDDDTASPSALDDDPFGHDKIASQIITAPGIMIPMILASVPAAQLARAVVVRSTAVCRWLLARTRDDVFHPRFEPRPEAGMRGMPYVVFGGRVRDWRALAMLCRGEP